MGEPPSRGNGSDPPTIETSTLLDAIKDAEQNLERAPKATVKGMVPLHRPPAPTDPDAA